MAQLEESQWPRWERSEVLHLQTSPDHIEQPANTEDTPTHRSGIGEIMLQHSSKAALRFSLCTTVCI